MLLLFAETVKKNTSTTAYIVGGKKVSSGLGKISYLVAVV
jgi:3-phosphoglycerate kinase